MARKSRLLFVAVVIILVLAAGVFALLKLIHPAQVKASNNIDEILTLMLNSHLTWKTVQGEAQITFYGPNGETQTYVDKFSIVQPEKAYIESVSQDGSGQNTIWISDGSKSYSLDESSKTYQTADLPAFSKDLSLLPKTLADISNDVVYNHPFAMVIPLPVRDYLYPQWLPQGGGTRSLDGEDEVLNRKTWVISYQKGNNTIQAQVDQQTGIILKYSQQVAGSPTLDVEFTQIKFDASIPDGLFVLPAGYSPE